MSEKIELFSSWAELKAYQDDMIQDKSFQNDDVDEWIRTFSLRQITLKSSLQPEYLLLRQELITRYLMEETLLSALYTANYLKYSNLYIDAIDLAYEYYENKVYDVNKIEWIKVPDDISHKIILKSNGKNNPPDGDSKKYIDRYLSAQKKVFMQEVIKYNKEDKSIPFFLYQMTYYSLFSYGITSGIGKKSIKMNSYNPFCDKMLQINSGDNFTMNDLLYNYKFEKIFKPWIMNSYQALLKVNSKRKYYNGIDWWKSLELYHIHNPNIVCELCLEAIATAMSVDDINSRTIDLTKQIKNFAKNFYDTLEEIKLLNKFFYDYKRAFFCTNLKKQGNDIDEMIRELENELTAYGETYKCQNLESIKKQSKERMEKIFSTLTPLFCPALCYEAEENSIVKKRSEYISKQTPKDIFKLFKV